MPNGDVAGVRACMRSCVRAWEMPSYIYAMVQSAGAGTLIRLSMQ